MMIILIYIVLAYLGISVIYQLILAGVSRRSQSLSQAMAGQQKFLILVPAYKEDEVIIDSSVKNLRVNYPKELFVLVVIADQLNPTTIIKLEYAGVSVIRVSFEKSTKAKALNYAIRQINMDEYESIVVLDADNVMHPEFLNQACMARGTGELAIQGQRKAANFNNDIAVYDAIAENANTAMLCLGANRLHLSSKLSGSGMIFRKDIFLNTMSRVNAVGGFDKEMELDLTRNEVFVKYWGEAVVYDQKVDSSGSYSRQRGRWLQAQYAFFAKNIGSSFSYLIKGNFDYFHKVWQLALPPRALIIVFLSLIILVGAISNSPVIQIIAIVLMLMNVLTYVIITPREWLRKFGAQLMLKLPMFLVSNLWALSFMPKASKTFIHTTHRKAA